ncbi:hypothetical protein D3C85_788800 [compost metagenome]
MSTKKLLFFLLLFQSIISYSQLSIDYTKNGKWGNEEFGIEIQENTIIILHKNQGEWKNYHYAKDEFSIIETIVDNVSYFKSYVASSYTSQRLYHTNGSETSIENAEFKIITVKGLTDNSIEFSISDSWLERQNNIYPKTVVTEKIKSELNNKIKTSYSLKRLVD